jgi:uncharacterized membrane protein YhaH (DUF805 family)
MAAANPYQAPGAPVADAKSEQYSQVKVWSAAGRIGRVRYIAYSIGYSFLISLVLGALSALIGRAAGGGAVIALTGVAYALIFVVMFLLTIQRAHDFNATGWLSILVLIPLVNLIFWIIPGTVGENRFGAPTPPNRTSTVIVALIIPIVAAVGILAAVAIPAYQQYVQRAKAAQSR